MTALRKIELGDSARDTISGYKGIVIAITYWLNGCKRITIQSRSLKDGKPVDSVTFDAEQIAAVKPGAVPGPDKTHGGPSIAPARRQDPK